MSESQVGRKGRERSTYNSESAEDIFATPLIIIQKQPIVASETV